MSRSYFPTPEEAEAAFYDALERGDLDAMMAVWAEDEEVVCIHPGSSRLVGQAIVRDAWRQVFEQARGMRVRLSGQIVQQGLLLAISQVLEQLTVGSKTYPPVTATNIYHRGSDGWRMICHHASALPAPQNQPEEPPPVLH